LSELPPRAQRYVLAIDVLAVVFLVVLAVRDGWQSGDAVAAGAFLACSTLSIEVFRRTGAPPARADRAANDLTAAFLFPAVLLTHPLYAAILPIPLFALLQARATPDACVKWVFNTAVAVIVSGGTALGFDALAGSSAPRHLFHSSAMPRTVGALFFAIVAYVVLNNVLVFGIIRRVAPGTLWRSMFSDKEMWTLLAGDVCAGVVLTLTWSASPVYILFAMIPILLLQRGVLHADLVAAARHDAKTGLANPSWWREQAGRAVTRAQHGNEPVVLLVVDLDRFKHINDRHGHLRGDAVLSAVADTLRLVVRPGDLVGRFGGDEFTVLLSGIDEAQAMATADRLRDRVAHTVSRAIGLDGSFEEVTASVGVAVFGQVGVDLDGLLAAADGAMYEAKAMGGNCVRLARGDGPPLERLEPSIAPPSLVSPEVLSRTRWQAGGPDGEGGRSAPHP
jgi:diguanylate cyclase (GGDEF)-like protein